MPQKQLRYKKISCLLPRISIGELEEEEAYARGFSKQRQEMLDETAPGSCLILRHLKCLGKTPTIVILRRTRGPRVNKQALRGKITVVQSA